MAYRTACALPHPVSGVIALAGDIPPELDAAMLGHIPVVVIGRGSRDEWYSEEKLAADEARLGSASVKPVVVRFEGGHEWTPEFGETVSVRLREWRR